jgi:transcriptional regulator with XRE-family HTH domain
LIRDQQGLSLRALAEQCGLSANAISRIERGENSPTVSSLHLLSRALHVPITAFFEDERVQSAVFVSRGQRLRSEASGTVMESLGSGLQNQKLLPFLMRIEHDGEKPCEPVTHAGQEFVYCLAGEIEYYVGDAVYRLEVGDSLLLEATQPHCFRSVTNGPVSAIVVFQADDGAGLIHHRHLNS